MSAPIISLNPEYQVILKLADSLFIHKNYHDAKDIYKFLLNAEALNRSYYEKQLAKINSILPYKTYLENAAKLYNTVNLIGELETAREIYETAIREYPQISNEKVNIEVARLSRKIANENYTKYIELADSYLSDQKYTQAAILYRESLKYKVLDTRAMLGLNTAEKSKLIFEKTAGSGSDWDGRIADRKSISNFK